MTTNQILEILRVVAAELETLQSDPDFREMQHSDTFTTPNDLTLTDALQAVYEVEGAIQNLQGKP